MYSNLNVSNLHLSILTFPCKTQLNFGCAGKCREVQYISAWSFTVQHCRWEAGEKINGTVNSFVELKQCTAAIKNWDTSIKIEYLLQLITLHPCMTNKVHLLQQIANYSILSAWWTVTMAMVCCLVSADKCLEFVIFMFNPVQLQYLTFSIKFP